MAFAPYYPDGWKNGQQGGTPLAAEALQHYDDELATLSSAVDEKAEKSEIPASSRLVPTGGSATTFLAGDGAWKTPPDTNTTYQALTAAQASTGTDTAARTISAKVLHDEIARQIAEALAEPAG